MFACAARRELKALLGRHGIARVHCLLQERFC